MPLRVVTGLGLANRLPRSAYVTSTRWMTRRRLCAVRVFATNAIAIYELRACGPACAGRAAQRQSPTLTPGQRRRRRRLDQIRLNSATHCRCSALGAASLGVGWMAGLARLAGVSGLYAGL
jgi:hypothetical protein